MAKLAEAMLLLRRDRRKLLLLLGRLAIDHGSEYDPIPILEVCRARQPTARRLLWPHARPQAQVAPAESSAPADEAVARVTFQLFRDNQPDSAAA